MLADPEALEDVVFGEGGLVEALGAGATLVEMSTVGPDTIRDTVARIPRGVNVLDAPVRGSVPAAEQGSLRIVVGGDAAVYERWKPVLDTLGTPVHVGPLGAGAAMKLVNNLALMGVLATLAEALALADRLELDPGVTMDVLEQSPVGFVLGNVRGRLEAEGGSPQFRLDLAEKDLRLVRESAARRALSLPVTEAAHGWVRAAAEGGLADRDYSAVVGFVRDQPPGWEMSCRRPPATGRGTA
jgi:3-hydroxyisobutyrate dehydrogenase-like beta-hydroxyacid dehydrogenase